MEELLLLLLRLFSKEGVGRLIYICDYLMVAGRKEDTWREE